MKKIIGIGIFLIIILLSLTAYIYLNDNIRFKLSYEINNFTKYSNGKRIEVNIDKNNRIKYIKKDVVKEISTGTKIVYFGYPTCPWCRNIVETLIKVSNQKNIDIYYVDTNDSKIDKEFKDIKNYLSDYLKDSEDGKKLYVPNVFFIKDGNIIANHLSVVESYTNPYIKPTTEQKEELEKIYIEYIDRMIK